ncbi:hypothetical protein BDF22DRAFT_745569 [Syncephalis plumigaleata]|nr:hypothetical protein BDF22DRAFT_745569 [Syncephalis plumigaleata]
MISSISELLPNALPWWELMALTVAGYALYKVIHVECINPLAKVPGPRLSI